MMTACRFPQSKVDLSIRLDERKHKGPGIRLASNVRNVILSYGGICQYHDRPGWHLGHPGFKIRGYSIQAFFSGNVHKN